jgi:vacuolar protein sorting-associated protein 72
VPENVSREVSAKEFVSVTDTSAPEQIEVANVGARPAQELQLLDGIHAYANEVPPLAKPPSTSSTAFQTNLGASQPYFPSSPELHVALACIHEIPQSAKFGTQTPQILGRSGDLPGQHQFPTAPTQHAEPLIPSIPLVKEQAQRSLLILEQYRSLEQSTSSRRSAKNNAKDTVGDPSLLSSTMAPDAYPTFDSEQSRYLTGKMRKRGTEQLLPPAPVKARCALSGWPAKFRDPRTGLPYADLQTYKLIQRIIAGGCSWSGLLGAWVGPAYGDMGRPAKGVPEGFGLSPQRQDAPSAGIKAEM